MHFWCYKWLHFLVYAYCSVYAHVYHCVELTSCYNHSFTGSLAVSRADQLLPSAVSAGRPLLSHVQLLRCSLLHTGTHNVGMFHYHALCMIPTCRLQTGVSDQKTQCERTKNNCAQCSFTFSKLIFRVFFPHILNTDHQTSSGHLPFQVATRLSSLS